MRGLGLSEQFYRQVVSSLIARRLPQLQDRYAAGLIGYGSDVLAYDDEISRDHEWGPRGHIWLNTADYSRYARRLDRIFHEELPLEFLGFKTRFVVDQGLKALVPAPDGQTGTHHHLAITTVPRYLRIQYGLRRLPPTLFDWICLPEQKLLELTRGKVFYDPVGDISRVRQAFAYLPDDVWRFKLQYAWEAVDSVDVVLLNAVRGDTLSARINLNRLAEGIVRIVFLLNRRYCPGSRKWVSREFDTLPRLAGEIGPRLEECLVMADMRAACSVVGELLRTLVDEQNRLGVTVPVTLEAPDYRQEHQSFALWKVIRALGESLPPELQELEIHGGADQWVTNADVLIWAEQYGKLKSVYGRKGRTKRDGVGDRII